MEMSVFSMCAFPVSAFSVSAILVCNLGVHFLRGAFSVSFGGNLYTSCDSFYCLGGSGVDFTMLVL